jgi:hypothetical protein
MPADTKVSTDPEGEASLRGHLSPQPPSWSYRRSALASFGADFGDEETVAARADAKRHPEDE